MPSLAALAEARGADGLDLALVATGRNGADAIERFAEEVGLPDLETHLDPKSRLAAAMGVPGLPVTVLLDADGAEIARLLGEADWSAPEALAVVDYLLGAPAVIPSQRHRFDIPREVAYLNCAYMSPLMTEVVEAGRAAVARKARPWQIRPIDFFTGPDALRPLFARLIGADADGVALIPAASYGLAIAAANLPLGPGRRILVLEDQFPSNVYCWQARAAETGAEVATVGPGADGDLTAALLAAIDERTAIVACPHCRWTDGALLDLAAVGAAARAAGAALVLDLTQSAGALPFDAAAVRPDFVVAACYKWLLGPYATGFLWVAPEHRDGRPLEAGLDGPPAAPRTSPASSTTSPPTVPAPAASTWARSRTSPSSRWSRQRSPASSTGACPRSSPPSPPAPPPSPPAPPGSASPAATPRAAPATSSASPSPARSPPASPTASPPPRSTSACAAPACASPRTSGTTTRTSTA